MDPNFLSTPVEYNSRPPFSRVSLPYSSSVSLPPLPDRTTPTLPAAYTTPRLMVAPWRVQLPPGVHKVAPVLVLAAGTRDRLHRGARAVVAAATGDGRAALGPGCFSSASAPLAGRASTSTPRRPRSQLQATLGISSRRGLDRRLLAPLRGRRGADFHLDLDRTVLLVLDCDSRGAAVTLPGPANGNGSCGTTATPVRCCRTARV
ncbi:hypothetical protein PVAP13_3KG426600 [Panicum virgatum]|uniref:Uncharacterized protein n=2 Tax=Panicum virgatum TaxID=38727 RepID=A0A8T0V522_PANVG|nr:hypothetical protein PVAP13_3KG426600 [Panicum virgatum]KAG2629345.1 hypothetical protein PVAP13_3KG426600 [Panicum virgatum]KAG2629348.1 hypothetical protein PVAP13_3KG426600 [Panicum virgatum]KAG2629349.1 hypothetical protein PVAP13_3KG426600 [Panicum virgatum]